MRKKLAIATLLFLAAAEVAAASSLDLCFGNPFFCRPSDDEIQERLSTRFDLGVEVKDLRMTREGVRHFMTTLSADGQRIMVTTCRNYLSRPNQVQSPRTLDFCAVLLRG
jgi:hypothetical protein